MPEPLLDRRSESRRPGAYNKGVFLGQGSETGRARMDEGFRDADRNEKDMTNLLPTDPVLRTEDEAADRRAEDHALIRAAQAGDEAAFASLVERPRALPRPPHAGEESAFGSLVERHRARAWRVARGLVGSDEDAQDLVQEAFLRVFRSLSTFDFDHGFTTWLYRIVTNLAIDHLRKRRAAISTAASSDEESDFDLPDESGPRPSAGLEHLELAKEVEACLASLAP